MRTGRRRGRCGGRRRGADEGSGSRRRRAGQKGRTVRRDVDDRAADRAGVDVGRQDLDPAALGLVDEGVGRIEAHRLLVEQRAQELRARSGRAATSTGRPAGRRRRRGPWGSRSPRSRRPSTTRARPAASSTSGHCAIAPSTKPRWWASIASAERLRLIARRRPSASPGEKPANAIATSMTWSWKMIVPSVSRRTGSSEGVVVGDLEVGVHAQALAALDVRVDRAALDRPRAHDRDLDREVVEVLRARAPQRAHLRAALDLEDAGGLGAPGSHSKVAGSS